MTIPKPRKRAPRAPKRIARKVRPRKVRKTTRGQMTRTADRLFSLIVRSAGRCAYHSAGYGVCAGPMQCCHLVSRTYRNVRWSEDNAIAMCAGGHRLMTSRPLEWEAFILNCVLGAESFAALKRRALRPREEDMESVLVRLAARAVALGIDAKKT